MATMRKPVDGKPQALGLISGLQGDGSGGGLVEPLRDLPIPTTPFPGPFAERTAYHYGGAGSDGIEKPVCLPAIETSTDESSINRPLRVVDSTLLTSPTDAAYIRSRSVTPSPLGAPRDLLPRSKKPTVSHGGLLY